MKLEDYFETMQDKSLLSGSIDLSWTIAGLFDSICQACGNSVLLIVEDKEAPTSGKSKLICATGEHVRDSTSFSRKEFDVVDTRLLFSLESMGTVGRNLKLLSGIKFEIAQTVESESSPSLLDGFKLVAWLKHFEAEAIVECYKKQANVSVLGESGNSDFLATFFPEGNPEAVKYHSNCQVTRGSRGWRKWIRLEEAQAIMQANQTQQDVEFAHLKYGNGGLVKYFAPTHPDAKRFRSTTMLLRRS